VNRDGTWVVVVKCEGAASFRVGGLPQGRYAVSHTTEAGTADEPPLSVAADGVARLTMPGAGVLTFHRL
jgi:hypothetical protein